MPKNTKRKARKPIPELPVEYKNQVILKPFEEGTLDFYLHKSKVLNANRRLHHMAHANIVAFLENFCFKEVTEFLEQAAKTDKRFETNSDGALLEPIFERFKVTMIVFSPTKHRLDPSNLFPTLKPIVDACSGEGHKGLGCNLWFDDDWEHLCETSFRYGGLSGVKEYFRIVLKIKEVPAEYATRF